MPVLTAWSTPGAAMLITSAAGVSMAEATGAFLVSAALITLSGFSGIFEKMIGRIPIPIASGMLAGVLLRFGLEAFAAMHSQFELVFSMFCAYLLGRRLLPRYAIIVSLLVGVFLAAWHGLLRLDEVHLALATPVFTLPTLSWPALIGVALPLYVVTMASQNVPGVTVIRAAGFQVPVSPLIGIFGATVGALFLAFPKELVLAIAGFALLGTIGAGLAAAVGQEAEREPALLTFLVTASGVSLAGIGSAFWGLLAGLAALLVLRATPAAWRRLFRRPG